MKTLLVIDLQNDFCPGGALAVAGGDEIVSGVNAAMEISDLVVLTQDWHPQHHASFASSHAGREPFSTIEMPYGTQVLWPDHCVQDSVGAEFHPGLDTGRAAAVIRKGLDPAIDSYSAFFENDRQTPTGLAGYLRDQGCHHIIMAGLATDYCVAWSALDAAALGFEVRIEMPLCRAIDLDGSLRAAMSDLHDAGVELAE